MPGWMIVFRRLLTLQRYDIVMHDCFFLERSEALAPQPLEYFAIVLRVEGGIGSLLGTKNVFRAHELQWASMKQLSNKSLRKDIHK